MITKQEAEMHLRALAEYIGENPDRPGLLGTPDRIVRMWGEIFRGYDPAKHPKITTFDNGLDGIAYDNMILDSGNYYSMCEHHAMPFFGKYVFAYIPNPKGKILGLSKIGRVVDYHAARLQIQERLVADIVADLSAALGKEYPPVGMALLMEGEHLCKTMRGARKPGKMSTCQVLGVFRDNINAKNEFLQVARELMK